MRWMLRLALSIGTVTIAPAIAQMNSPLAASAPQVPAKTLPVPPLSAAAFVDQVVTVNLFEIEASKLVLERRGDEQLVTFAKQSVLDNTKLVERLSEVRNATIAALDPEHRQILSDLRQSEGVLFAKRYVQEQVRAHQQAIQLYERYAENGTDEVLREIAEQALATARPQLRRATLLGQRYLPGP